MKIYKLSSWLKGLAEEMMLTGNSYLFLLKGKIKITSHQFQVPLDDQPWNGIKFMGNPIGNLGNHMGTFKSHTNALIRWDEQSTPSSCKRRFLIRQNFIHQMFFLGCPSNFADHRMGLCEWMAWVWSAHNPTPFIHNTLVIWMGSWSGIGSSTITRMGTSHASANTILYDNKN